jgi:hypothetical protein
MRLCICLMTLVVLPSFSRAAEPWVLFDGARWSFPSLCAQWQERGAWCPNDYCPKALPATPPSPKGCVDDYKPKSLPTVPPCARGSIDDYCPRPCSLILERLCAPWYRCGPP